MNNKVKTLYCLHNCNTIIRHIPDEEGCCVFYPRNVFNGMPQLQYEYSIKRDMLYVLNSTDVIENYYEIPKESRRLAVVIDIILKTFYRNISMEHLQVESEVIQDNSIIAFFTPPTNEEIVRKENALKTLLNDILFDGSCQNYIEENGIETGHEYLLNLVNNGGF